jgi:general secretion pathway protein A
VVQAVVADMGLDVDVAPEPVAPSPLDSVAEVEEAPAAEIADEADSEAVVGQEEAEATAPAPFAAPFAAPQVDESPVAEASPDAAMDEPFYTAFDAVEEPVEAWDEQEAEEEPEMVESATFEQSQPEQIEPQPVATIDADQVDALRHDMLAEIEALRAEISSLRAVQAHVPFTPAQTVDPEALKDCFTLIEERLQSLEFRAEEQDTALRRVLTLLVDWVEREERMATPRDSAAA